MFPLYVVVDDIQFPTMNRGTGLPGVDQAFGHAAYVIDRPGMEAVLGEFVEAKLALGLDADDPIKAVMDQEIGRAYRARHGIDEGERRFRIARANVRMIGERVLGQLAERGGRVVVSMVWPFSPTPDRQDLTQWAFEDLLQRVAFILRSRGSLPASSVVLLADRPDEPRMHASFREGLFRGKTTRGSSYLAGSLGDLGMIPSLAFSSTPDSLPLQVADFVARGCRDFISWCNNPRLLPDLFMPIAPALHRSGAGQIDRYGFLLTPRVGWTIDEKLRELRASTQGRSAEGL